MCRLMLLNAAAVRLFSPRELVAVLQELEASLGGDGNGVAALWPATARVKVRKGLTLTPDATARTIEGFVQQGAEWLLYHARMATAGPRTARNCHPFRH